MEWPASLSKLSHADPWVGTNFSGGGPNSSEKFVPGGTNLRGVQTKRDIYMGKPVTMMAPHCNAVRDLAT